MKNIEQELKLQLTEREYNVLHALGDGLDVEQVNYYFYYDNMPLKTMVRIRKKQGVYTLCYKDSLSQRNSVSVCRELECEITEGLAKSFMEKGISQQQLMTMLNISMPEPLRCIGNLTTIRKVINISGMKVELDRNSYLGVTDYELECECDNVEQLETLKNYLQFNYGITLKPSCAKSKRFAERLAGIPMMLGER